MDWESINNEMAVINGILSSWRKNNRIDEIEKDILAEKLRSLYERTVYGHLTAARETDVLSPENAGGEAAEDAVTAVAAAEEEMAVQEDAVSYTEEDESPVAHGSEEPDQDRHSKNSDHSGHEEDVIRAIDIETFDRFYGVKGGRKALLSLYDDDEPVSPARGAGVASDPEEERDDAVADIPEGRETGLETALQSEPAGQYRKTDRENARERTATIGETIRTAEKTLADSYAANNNAANVADRITSGRIEHIGKAIGINDKFLIIRDLFGGDAGDYIRVIDELETFDDLDEAVLHIHENYGWNPHSEGARLIIDLLTRKLS